MITADQLISAIEAQGRDRDQRLGEILVGLGFISQDELHKQIRVQIEEAVFFLFTWTQGTFNFEPDIRPEAQDFLVSISPESLLLEGAQRVDEWSLIEKKIPAFNIIFQLERERAEAARDQLTDQQRALLPLVDGKRDVAALVEETGLIEFEVGKALFGLITAGFAHRVGKSRPAESVATESHVEEHRNLGIAFYRTGMLDEAEREFRRVVDLRPGDVRAHVLLGLAHLRLSRWDDAVGDFEHAAQSRQADFAVFHNLSYAWERMGQLGKSRDALREALRRGGERDARVHTSLGVLALHEGDLDAAAACFLAARPLFTTHAPSPAWFHYAALTAALGGRTDDAIATLSEGTEAYPHSAVLHNNLAVALERLRKFSGSITAIERGVSEDPSIAQLHKNLGDHHYRQARLDEAFESYQRAVKYDEKLGADVWLKLGNIHLKRLRRADAVTCWERALALDPESQVIRHNLEAVRGKS